MAPRSRSKAQPAPVQPRSRSTAQPAPVQPAPAQPAPVEEETIDLDEVSDTSEEEDTPPAHANTRTAPAAGANAPGDETTHVAPIIIKPAAKSNRALDIDLLFDRGKGKPSVCKYCR